MDNRYNGLPNLVLVKQVPKMLKKQTELMENQEHAKKEI